MQDAALPNEIPRSTVRTLAADKIALRSSTSEMWQRDLINCIKCTAG